MSVEVAGARRWFAALLFVFAFGFGDRDLVGVGRREMDVALGHTGGHRLRSGHSRAWTAIEWTYGLT